MSGKPVAIGPTSRTVIGAAADPSPKSPHTDNRRTLKRLAIYAGIGGAIWLALRVKGHA